jgi:extracellular elastinolytic metalloproteinase
VAKNGSIFSYGNSFYSGAIPSPTAQATATANDPVKALASVNGVLGLSITSTGAKAESQGSNRYVIKGTQGAHQDPKAQLVYFQTPKKELVLTWRVETDIYRNWLLSYSNVANTEHILGVVDYTAGANYQVL